METPNEGTAYVPIQATDNMKLVCRSLCRLQNRVDNESDVANIYSHILMMLKSSRNQQAYPSLLRVFLQRGINLGKDKTFLLLEITLNP